MRLRHVSHMGREKIACDLPGMSADGPDRLPQERAGAVGVACYLWGIGERMCNLTIVARGKTGAHIWCREVPHGDYKAFLSSYQR